MKRALLVMVLSAMLVTLGFAQTPDTGSNTDPTNVKGCLGGSDGNYTVVENGTGQIFKITTSSVDLKPHLSHEVQLVGHKSSGDVSSGAADNSFAVTELSMISEHCASAAAAPAATVIPPSETVIPPDAAAAPATVGVPAVDAAAPTVPVNPPAATVSTPAVEPAVPAATVSPSSAIVSTPAVAPVHAPRTPAHAQKVAVAQAAAPTAADTTVGPPSDTVAPVPQDAAAPAPSPETVSSPDAALPAPAVTHRTGSLALLVAFVILVILLGTTAPLIGRWRKRRMLERSGSPNLSFTNEESASEVSDGLDKPEPRKVA